MSKRGRTLEANFQKHIRLAKLATAIGYIAAAFVLLSLPIVADSRARIGVALIALAMAVSGKFWARRFYRCSSCAARIWPKGGPFFGTPPVHCPHCQQKLLKVD